MGYMTETCLGILFVCYGTYNSNSGGHIAGFAQELSQNGRKVCVLVSGWPDDVYEYGKHDYKIINYEDRERDCIEEVEFFFGDCLFIVHAWTPRERVRILTEALVKEFGCSYIVHLEDNEMQITESQLGRRSMMDCQDADFPLHLSHPLKHRAFLDKSVGVTIIVSTLQDFVPEGIPFLLLRPGVDINFFKQAECGDITRQRSLLYIDDASVILAYHGNMHHSNRREIFSLYVAVLILNRRGIKAYLLRTGLDFVPHMDESVIRCTKGYVLDFGRVGRGRMLELLQLADVYVQPGSNTEFNFYRLPSKIPEFLALGRPVILPASNIGLEMRDNEDAILLKKGTSVEIADIICYLLERPLLSQSLGANARLKAEDMRWDVSAARLLSFYEKLFDAE